MWRSGRGARRCATLPGWRISTGGLRRFAVLTDGAARIVNPFGEMSWAGLLDLAETESPETVLRRVREVEVSDPLGVRWPRNKRSDDATLILALDVEQDGRPS